MKNYQKILTSCLIIFSCIWAANAWAAIVPCGTEENPEPCALCHLWQLGSNIINFIVWQLSIPVAALLFISAGVIFMTSGGSEERVGLGKKIFLNTAIGLIIVFCSWLLIDTIFKTLASGEFSAAWNKFPSCLAPPT